MHIPSFTFITLAATLSAVSAETRFIEAESMTKHGGWTLDTQFIEIMGSPYLIAHGLGKPVEDAQGTVKLAGGEYQAFVRTKDWVAHWKAEGAPGKFQLAVNGKALPNMLGIRGENWGWQSAGKVTLPAGEHTVSLKDVTGFNGRCDAIVLSSDPNFTPADDAAALAKWRKQQLGLPEVAPETQEYDLVVVGGGYAGMGAALSAARMGIKVALLQNRPVLGGNGSSEIQVWAKGGTRRGKYPHLGEIVEEFADSAQNSPGVHAEYGDAKKEALVRSEPNITLFLNTHAVSVVMHDGADKKIRGVGAIDTRTGAVTNFRGKFFVDCTGHAYVAALAGAKYRIQETGHMGMSNMWKWAHGPAKSVFPNTPWALPLQMGDFPDTPKSKGSDVFYKGEWFWESGFNHHPLDDLEHVRDWNLRAVFGAFQAMKNGAEAEKYSKADLQWVAVIGGPRESRTIDGDIILTQDDIVKKADFPDGCVPTTWDIDLHYPKEQYAVKFPDNPFISRAAFGEGVDRANGYPLPYRSFYSKNVNNLFMAGRNISVTHEALGTVRVMRTCGMMGEVVGKAASLCIEKNTTPRGVYADHLASLIEMMKLPGASRRASVTAPMQVPAVPTVFPPNAGDAGRTPPIKLELAKLKPGLAVDDDTALLEGKWTVGDSLEKHVGKGYRYAGANANAQAIYAFTIPKSGKYEVRIAWHEHQNRASNTLCVIDNGKAPLEVRLNQKTTPALPMGFTKVAEVEFSAETPGSVTISTTGANGNVHADAVWLVPVE